MRIAPIAPAHVEDFVGLFDTAFTDNPAWAGCYCAFYDADWVSDEDWESDSSAADANRTHKAALIRSGAAHGLLAFEGGTAIGWCNAGPRSSYATLRAYARAIEDPDEAVGCVMCFVVHPDHRRRGVAAALLGAVDDYFRALDLTVAEGYPRLRRPADPSFPWTAAFHKGTIEMYEAAGYVRARDLDGFAVMRKPLAPDRGR